MSFFISDKNGQTHEIQDEYDPQTGENIALNKMREQGYPIEHRFVHAATGQEAKVSDDEYQNDPHFKNEMHKGTFTSKDVYNQKRTLQPVKSKIAEQAALTGADPDVLKTSARARGVPLEDDPFINRVAASASGTLNQATGNVVPWLYKKAHNEPTEHAIDEVDAVAAANKNPLQSGTENAIALAAPMPGGGANTLAQQAVRGMGYGAVGGLTSSQSGHELESAAEGSVLGGATSGALGAVGKIPEAADAVRGFAGRQAIRAVNPNASQVKKLDKVARGEIEGLGNEMIDKGLVKPFDKSSQIAERASEARDVSGKKLGDAMKLISDDAGSIYPRKMYKQYENYLNENYGVDPKLREQMMGQMKDYIDQYAVKNANGQVIAYKNIPFDEAYKHRKQLDDILAQTYNKTAPATSTDLARMQQRKILDDEIMNSVDKASGETGIGADQVRSMKRDYQLNKSVQDIGESQQLKELSRRSVSPSDMGAAMTGVMAGGPKGAVLGLGNYLARNYGSSTMGVAASKISKAMKNPKFGEFAKVLNDAASRGNAAFLATHGILMKTNPEYQALIEGDGQ